jgi:alcohol dehydrogenase class IV
VSAFTWSDGDRLIRFGPGAGEHAWPGADLLSTPRARATIPAALRDGWRSVHDVPAGQVTEIAAALVEELGDGPVVAWGGGRVIDTAKAVAAARGGRVCAVPTTLSGAEMTGIHRIPAGAEDRIAGLVRPTLVIAEPAAMTGLPEPRLRASAMNALAHAADSLYTPFANPVSRMTALRGAALIATALDEERAGRDRAALALGAILSGYAIDSGLFAIHHVVCQTLVRVCGSPHAETNAGILPRAMAFMAPRAPAEIAALAAAIGTDPDRIEERILGLGGNPAGLGAVGADRERLGEAVDAILERAELAFTPSPPGREELTELIERVW